MKFVDSHTAHGRLMRLGDHLVISEILMRASTERKTYRWRRENSFFFFFLFVGLFGFIFVCFSVHMSAILKLAKLSSHLFVANTKQRHLHLRRCHSLNDSWQRENQSSEYMRVELKWLAMHWYRQVKRKPAQVGWNPSKSHFITPWPGCAFREYLITTFPGRQITL